MLSVVLALLVAGRVFLRSRPDVALELLALRQQVASSNGDDPAPPWTAVDRLLWTVSRQMWARWKDVTLTVKPETVVGWQRAGFRR